MTPRELARFRRRVLGLSIVAICALSVLAGCSTPDMVCDMKADYSSEVMEAMSGDVRIHWQYGRVDLPANVNGITNCFPGDPKFCVIEMRGKPASFHDICAMAKQVHEMKHGFGAKHKD